MKYLEKLARIFQDNKSRLYVVGSFVRKIICGDNAHDVDVCGKLTPPEIEKILDGTEFYLYNVKDNYYRTQIGVKGRSDVHFDYTAFRKDYYKDDGRYHPTKIVLAKTIREDYVRRDFTVNAIYYDPLINEYYDYCGGLVDLQHRLLKTVIDPNKSFSNDVTRIVRLIKTAVDGPYNIEFNTFQAAKNQAHRIDIIKDEMFYEEINKIKNKELGFKLLKEIFPWKKF